MRTQSFHPLHKTRPTDYYGESRPAAEINWDFFEILPLEDRNLVCSIGNVSGSGIADSFTMASLRAFLRALMPYHRGSAAELVRELNRAICELAPRSFYAALFYAWMEPANFRLTYVNAGQMAAWRIRRHGMRVSRLENTGTMIGLNSRTGHRQRTIEMEPGDLLVAASDGVCESLGEGKMLELIGNHLHSGPATIVNEILDSTGPGRDRTVVAVRLNDCAAREAMTAHTADLAAAC